MNDRKYVFVGERRSDKAIAMKVRWQDGHLAAKPLFEALRLIGLDPQAQLFMNLFHERAGDTVAAYKLKRVKRLARLGYAVVAMGRQVQRQLASAGIPCLPLVHPAARGRIRKTERYRQHVKDTLSMTPIPPRPTKRRKTVTTPCVSKCVLKNGVCEGCKRTVQDIAAWSNMREADRIARMVELAA